MSVEGQITELQKLEELGAPKWLLDEKEPEVESTKPVDVASNVAEPRVSILSKDIPATPDMPDWLQDDPNEPVEAEGPNYGYKSRKDLINAERAWFKKERQSADIGQDPAKDITSMLELYQIWKDHKLSDRRIIARIMKMSGADQDQATLVKNGLDHMIKQDPKKLESFKQAAATLGVDFASFLKTATMKPDGVYVSQDVLKSVREEKEMGTKKITGPKTTSPFDSTKH